MVGMYGGGRLAWLFIPNVVALHWESILLCRLAWMFRMKLTEDAVKMEVDGRPVCLDLKYQYNECQLANSWFEKSMNIAILCEGVQHFFQLQKCICWCMHLQ